MSNWVSRYDIYQLGTKSVLVGTLISNYDEGSLGWKGMERERKGKPFQPREGEIPTTPALGRWGPSLALSSVYRESPRFQPAALIWFPGTLYRHRCRNALERILGANQRMLEHLIIPVKYHQSIPSHRTGVRHKRRTIAKAQAGRAWVWYR